MQFVIDKIRDEMAQERNRRSDLMTQRKRVQAQLDHIDAQIAECDRNLNEMRDAQVKLAKV